MTTVRETMIDSKPHRWRVLTSEGNGPVALCLHGAGGSSDSFRPLMAALGREMTMVAPDLPGHGGTRLGAPFRSGLTPMAEDVTALAQSLAITPDFIIGHSAGAAIALEADAALSPRGHVLINAALGAFDGVAGWIFPALAKGLAATPFAAQVISGRLRDGPRLEKLLASTGSEISPEIVARYAALAANPDHISGTLRMMAAWKLSDLLDRLKSITTPVLLLAGESDGTVPVSVSKSAEKTLADAKLTLHPGGHLLHEESPDMVADDIRRFIAKISDQPT